MTPTPATQPDAGLPTGSRSILPTIWLAFVTTVLLALAFSFANVWELARSLHVERHVAPLIGPTVDITAIGLLIVVPWLVMAGARDNDLRGAKLFMAFAGVLTLALNSAPSAIRGWTQRDATAWGRAAVEAIVPALLITWSHIGPRLIGLFMEVRERHQAKIAEALRVAEAASTKNAEQRAAEIEAAVMEALRRDAVERDAALAEDRAIRAAEVEAVLRDLAERGAALDAALAKSSQLEAEVVRLCGRTKAAKGGSAKPSTTRSATTAEDAPKPPRKSAAELLEERVEAAKEALPMWQIETPSGPEIRSALGIKSDGIISEIRKRLDSDRLAITSGGSQ